MTPRNMPRNVLVVGLAATGEAVVRHCRGLGDEVTVVEDRPGGRGYDRYSATVAELGVTLVESPSPADVGALAEQADLVVPSPGVPERHPALAAALRLGVPVRAEIDLAAELVEVAGGPTLLAVTGTNGKTTVTMLATAMLTASGIGAAAAGNIGQPLIDAVQEASVEVVVAEVSSFQLNFTEVFRPRAAALLNIGADHLDWHRTFDAYAHAKAGVFGHQRDDDLLAFNADDPVVAGLAANAPARRVAFSVAEGAATGYRVVQTADGRLLVGADGVELAPLDALERRGPHDIANALAAAAIARAAGATPQAIAATLASFPALAHRMQPVGEHAGVRYIDDSKATNVHATVAAVRGLETSPSSGRVVLVAGGRNKDLDLSELRVVTPHLRAVVAIGEAAPEVAQAFAGVVPVTIATSMHDAVRAAAAAATSGDTVLLSPACASFDWYESYAARGDDFAREVRSLVELGP